MKLFLNFKLVTETKNIIIYKYFRMVIFKTYHLKPFNEDQT